MRTVEVTQYRFEELSAKAKERAIQDYVEAFGYNWGNEALESIKKLAKHFDSCLKDWSVDWLCPERSFFRFTEVEMGRAEIWARLKKLGSFNKETFRGHGECVLTGVFTDEECIDGFRIAWFNGERNLCKLLESAGRSLLQGCCKDFEHQLSEEVYQEFCQANDYWFEENGELA